MAKKNVPETETGNGTAANSGKYKGLEWYNPNKRGKNYAEELKSKKHRSGPAKDQELTDIQKSHRRGYLQCQKDHSSSYKYHLAKSNGFSKAECKTYSNLPLSELKDAIKRKGGKNNG